MEMQNSGHVSLRLPKLQMSFRQFVKEYLSLIFQTFLVRETSLDSVTLKRNNDDVGKTKKVQNKQLNFCFAIKTFDLKEVGIS